MTAFPPSPRGEAPQGRFSASLRGVAPLVLAGPPTGGGPHWSWPAPLRGEAPLVSSGLTGHPRGTPVATQGIPEALVLPRQRRTPRARTHVMVCDRASVCARHHAPVCAPVGVRSPTRRTALRLVTHHECNADRRVAAWRIALDNACVWPRSYIHAHEHS